MTAPFNRRRSLIGMLTPSSNTILEPVTTQILASIPNATAHFGRFRVTQIALRACQLSTARSMRRSFGLIV